MMFAGAALASSALASQTALSNATSDALANRPIDVTIDGVSWRLFILVDSLSIDDTLGEQTSCSFTIMNPDTAPEVGNVVEVWFYAQCLFSGTIDEIVRGTNNTLTAQTYACTCTDWSQVLMRHILRRNFSQVSVQNLCDTLLANELAGEGLTFGTADKATAIPLIDSRSGRVFDVLRDAAGVTGQTFYVDFDKKIQFRATTNEAAPLALDLTTIEMATIKTDRETYRNVQTVIVTGTPPDASTDAVEFTLTRQNDDQITARAALEGGSGRYEAIEEVTHPTSNDPIDCQLLAIGYATLRLAVSGVPRQTLTGRVRGYGFRAGQFASLDVVTLGVSGTWLIQRIQLTEQDGNKLLYNLELVQSSLQQRAYESWLKIVEAGKLVVQMPSAITANSVTFNTPGTTTWTVPTGVTVAQFTAVGGSGGGGGANIPFVITTGCTPSASANGGTGGNSGKGVSIVTVIEDQVFDITVGSKGSAGANGAFNRTCGASDPTSGGAGTLSKISISGSVKAQGNPGGGGRYGLFWNDPATDGSVGSGAGDAVSVGGGRLGGTKGISGGASASAGFDGYVEVSW